MDIKTQNELEFIKNSILQIVPAETIYLFGSYAYGTPNTKSDFDIYVVVPDETTNLFEIQADIRNLLWNKKTIPLDLLMGRTSVFNRRKNGPTLEKFIFQEGIVLHGA